jgi:hypothetical protein
MNYSSWTICVDSWILTDYKNYIFQYNLDLM